MKRILLGLALLLTLSAPAMAQVAPSDVRVRGLFRSNGAEMIGNPCGSAALTTVAVSVSTAANNQIVALSGSTLIYVCGFWIRSSGTESVQWIYGTGSACATGETDISGVIPLLVGEKLEVPVTGATQFVVPAGNALCLELAAGSVAQIGWLTYVQTATP